MNGAWPTRVLIIDLSRKNYRVSERPELFERRLGGAGAAIRLLQETCPPGVAPDAPEAPIVLAVGPLTGLFPLASKTVAMFKSPLTGNLGESHAGGRSAQAIRMAGYGAIVICGESSLPVIVAVHGSKVFFRDATTVWGMKSLFTAGSIIRDSEPGAGSRSIMRIGRGGENRVAYASVTSETYRHFGRLGLGAVMGAKKLKALVVSGERSIPVADPKRYRALYDEIYRAATGSPAMKKYHDLGTAGNVRTMQALRALPTRNLQQGTFAAAEKISGEYLAEHYLGRRLACAHCPVGCIHIAAVREPYPNEPYFYKTTMVGYDWELIYALGSDLGIAEPEGMLLLIDAVEKAGIDAMSTGVCLAWATEALEKGLVTVTETAGLKLAWGDWKTYIRAVECIVSQPNDFWRALATGTSAATKRYGGGDFAMAFGSNEMPGYPTGPASFIGLLIGGRHSHLCNAGYSLDQNMIMTGKTLTPEEIVDGLLMEEIWRQVLTSLSICLFARSIYTPELVRETLSCAGYGLNDADILALGKEIYKEKYRFKESHGFSLDALPLPGRMFEFPAPAMPFDRAFIEAALACAKERIGSL
jgi:aldehyde:ferredoxin oxidoreductase